MNKTISFTPSNQEEIECYLMFKETFPEININVSEHTIHIYDSASPLTVFLTLRLWDEYDNTVATALFDRLADYYFSSSQVVLKLSPESTQHVSTNGSANKSRKERMEQSLLETIDTQNIHNTTLKMFNSALTIGWKLFNELKRDHEIFKMYAVFIGNDGKFFRVGESHIENANGQSTDTLHAEQALTNKLQKIPLNQLKMIENETLFLEVFVFLDCTENRLNTQ